MGFSFFGKAVTVGHVEDRSFHIEIEVPDRTNPVVRSPAGEMKIVGITGDKNVELKAGNLTIDVGDASGYRVAEGSVMAEI